MNTVEKEWLKLNRLTKKGFIEECKGKKLILVGDLRVEKEAINFLIAKEDNLKDYYRIDYFPFLNKSNKQIDEKIEELVLLVKEVGNWIGDEEFIKSADTIKEQVYQFFKENEIFVPDEKTLEEYDSIDAEVPEYGEFISINEILYLEKIAGLNKKQIFDEIEDWCSFSVFDGYETIPDLLAEGYDDEDEDLDLEEYGREIAEEYMEQHYFWNHRLIAKGISIEMV